LKVFFVVTGSAFTLAIKHKIHISVIRKWLL